MKYEFAGRYMWHGVFLDPDDEAEREFGIFADTFEDAASEAKSFPGEVIHLERGEDMSQAQLPEIPEGLVEKLEALKKKALN
jgi:hypothetical protein